MRFTYKFLMLLFVAAFALPFVTLGPGGGPLLKWPSSSKLATPPMPDLGKITQSVQQALGSDPAATSGAAARNDRQQTVYKWHDAGGKLHITDTPPPSGTPYESRVLDATQANIIPAAKPRPDPAQAAQTGQAPSGLTLPYSPQRVDQIMNQTQEAAKLMEQRQTTMKEILGD